MNITLSLNILKNKLFYYLAIIKLIYDISFIICKPLFVSKCKYKILSMHYLKQSNKFDYFKK